MELLGRLRAIGKRADPDIDLAQTALLLAALDCPGVALSPYSDHLRAIAEDAASVTSRSASVGLQSQALREILAVRYGYHGDLETYDDLRNANLIHVIDRRKGLPVSLGILLLHAARSYGASIAGLSFPSHFLVRLTARGERAIIDAFDGARVVEAADLRRRLKDLHGPAAEMEPDHFRDVANRDILIRLQNNIKLRAIAADQLPRALETLETMIALAPGRSELWWETAVLQSRLGNLKSAIVTLETCLAEGAGSGRAQLEDLLERLRSRVN